jgi:hypothetical protein
VENPVRLVGSYCFSGGLHQLAFTLPHVVCSTLTDFRSEAFRKTGHDLTYSNKVWGTFHSSQQKTPRTLYHAHWTAMTGEGMNDGRGSLSSMAYVDSVLGQGPFAALPAKAVAKCEKHASLVHSGEIQRLLQLSFDGPGRPAAAIQPLEDPDGWQVLARSESIRTVEEADEDSWSQVSRSEAGPLPLPALGPERAAMMGLLQADLARDYDLAKKDHAKAALARKRELLRMEEEWNQLSLPAGAWTPRLRAYRGWQVYYSGWQMALGGSTAR